METSASRRASLTHRRVGELPLEVAPDLLAGLRSRLGQAVALLGEDALEPGQEARSDRVKGLGLGFLGRLSRLGARVGRLRSPDPHLLKAFPWLVGDRAPSSLYGFQGGLLALSEHLSGGHFLVSHLRIPPTWTQTCGPR